LLQQGCQLVARNFRCRGGEIDLIVRQGKVLIFIEVRLRSSRGYASSLESITLQKQRRIIRCAQYFLLCHPQWNDYNTRFDVVALDKLSGEPDWVQSAFEYHGF
jgi:putative endonuclease